ncbi:hypothetical protein D4764_01G0001720 [Takifugu flavidus]|uniref:Uncharacterized protein n=1 Tax=Takifugu flavidus TaxID=433684 RepID=A0A5C6PPU6_9TELE|nr:hypothetical protein D4764_01G0001720 [Takifugu flavidus]
MSTLILQEGEAEGYVGRVPSPHPSPSASSVVALIPHGVPGRALWRHRLTALLACPGAEGIPAEWYGRRRRRPRTRRRASPFKHHLMTADPLSPGPFVHRHTGGPRSRRRSPRAGRECGTERRCGADGARLRTAAATRTHLTCPQVDAAAA